MAEEKVGFFKRLVNGLTKTRDSIVDGIDSIFSGYSNIDDDFYEEIEEILVMGDIGINTTQKGCSCGSRYVPCSGRRAAHGVGAPRRRGYHRRTERSRSGVHRVRCSRSGKSQKCGCADL